MLHAEARKPGSGRANRSGTETDEIRKDVLRASGVLDTTVRRPASNYNCRAEPRPGTSAGRVTHSAVLPYGVGREWLQRVHRDYRPGCLPTAVGVGYWSGQVKSTRLQ